MSPSEYQELVEFLTGQFVAVDHRLLALQRHMDENFLEVDRRFARVDERFQEILGHFDEVYRRLERLEQEYHAISQQLRRIEVGLTDEKGRREILERDLARLKEQVVLLQARIADIERRVGGQASAPSS